MNWKVWVGFGLSAFLIWFTLRDVDIGEVWTAMRSADLLLLGASIFVATFGFLFRALRWKVLLHPVEPNTRLHDRWAAVNIAFMANNLLPARAGEFARAFSFARLEPRVSVSAAFGSLVVERVLDGLVLAAFLVGAVMMPSFPDVELGGGFMAILKSAVVLLGGVGVVLALLLAFPTRVVGLTEGIARRVLPDRAALRVIEALEAFLQSLGVIRSPVLLTKAMAWTVFFWAWHGLSFWLGMEAFGIDAGPVAAYFTEAVVGFGVALPAAPGFFGTFHASAAFALDTVYQAGEVPTLAFAYGYHMGGFIPVTLIGLWYARSIGMSLGDVRDSEAKVEAAVDAELVDPEDLPRS